MSLLWSQNPLLPLLIVNDRTIVLEYASSNLVIIGGESEGQSHLTCQSSARFLLVEERTRKSKNKRSYMCVLFIIFFLIIY